ncbi:Uma2 family endonuclease [Spiractinospora alimapuensis]|nr:Uma2 family endonuclease [Spiractinospora alimapuensis]
MAVENPAPDTSLAELADQLRVPEGYRVEIIGGQVVVSPTPLLRHARIVSRLFRAPALAVEGLVPLDMVSIELPDSEERYIPDLVFLPEEVNDDEWLIPVSEVALAVEVTSPGNPEHDRVRKLRGYARAAVPIYLLIDTGDETVTLFENPRDGAYHRQTRVDMGGTITLPAPFSGELDTKPFVARGGKF